MSSTNLPNRTDTSSSILLQKQMVTVRLLHYITLATHIHINQARGHAHCLIKPPCLMDTPEHRPSPQSRLGEPIPTVLQLLHRSRHEEEKYLNIELPEEMVSKIGENSE